MALSVLRELSIAPEPLSFAQWETFYVIVGSSGGALTGLLFVVVALAAERRRQGSSQGLGAFTTEPRQTKRRRR
ncbi:MAG: hypothetical protein ACREPM_12550 [Gemmatimonadaceae bacterium]